MQLHESYQLIKPSIVAFASTFKQVNNSSDPPADSFPPIIGTGFIVADGLVVTNHHVVEAISRLPKPPDAPEDLWPAHCILLHFIPNKGMASIGIEILGFFGIEDFKGGKNYYGPPKPDIAFVHINMKDLPKAKVNYDPSKIIEGIEVATAGFPMGTRTLTAPGYLHQLTPTLQQGVISAVLPFQCATPHSIIVNIMAQGGVSGSPVFLPESGDVIGVLYAGLHENNGAPTNISYMVPAYYLQRILSDILKDKNLELPANAPSLQERRQAAEQLSDDKVILSSYRPWAQKNPFDHNHQSNQK